MNKTSRVERNIKYFFLKECVELDGQSKVVKSLVTSAHFNDIRD